MPRIGRPRSGLALFEFAALLLIVGLLVGIGVPAVQQSRARVEDRRATRTVTLTLQTAQTAVRAGTPLAALDAATLGERDGTLRYVDAETASDGPDVVSVGVVGDAWVAASRSRTGRCAVGRLDLATLADRQDLVQVAVCSAAEAGILPIPAAASPDASEDRGAAAAPGAGTGGPGPAIGAVVTSTRPGPVTPTTVATTGAVDPAPTTTRAGAVVPTVPGRPADGGATTSAPPGGPAAPSTTTTVRSGSTATTTVSSTTTSAGTTTTAAATTTTTAPASVGSGGGATQVVTAEGGAVSFAGTSAFVRGTIGAWAAVTVDEAADITGDVLSRTGAIQFGPTATPHRITGTVFADGDRISLDGSSSTITGAAKAWSDITLQGTVAGTAQSRTGTVDCRRVSGSCTTGGSPGVFPPVDGPDWNWDAANYPTVTEHASGASMTAWLSANASAVSGVHKAWEGFSVNTPLNLTGDTVLVSDTGTIMINAPVTTTLSTPVRLVLVTGADILVTTAFPADPKVYVAMHAWADVTFQQAVGLRGWILTRTGRVLFSGAADLTYAAVRDPGFA